MSMSGRTPVTPKLTTAETMAASPSPATFDVWLYRLE
jgi:hypothetical protein